MQTLRLPLLLFLPLSICFAAYAEPKDEKEPTPGEVYKAFIIAVSTGDKEGAAKICLPDQDLDVLCKDKLRPEEIEEVKKGLARENYRVLKVGETFTFPNGKTLTIEAKSVELGWVMIVGEIDPLPHMLQKVDGHWLVDPGDVIAIRKRAWESPNQ